jgi:hypothetical protein
MRVFRATLALALVNLVMTAAFAQLPDPATGGRAGKPIDVLLLRGHAEMNFGQQPPLDEQYQQQLLARGYRLTQAQEWQPLTSAYLQQFNVVIYLNPSPAFGGGYFDHTGWRSGPHLLTVRANQETLHRYVADGGSLFIVPALEEIGTRTTESLQLLFKPYGLTTECAVVRDPAHTYEAAKVLKVFPIDYGWTEQLAAHPVTDGVKRIYYPSYCTRWDDNYTTIPLFPTDPAWIRLAQSMPGAQSAWLRGTIYDPSAKWIPAPGRENPALLVARSYGKGRLAVTGISPFHLFYLTYSKTGAFAEANFVRVDGIAMDKGDGTTPSDLHRLLDNLYRWLAQGSLAAGMGGFDSEKGVQLAEAAGIDKETILADVWAEGDPATQGPVRPMRILVGAHSAMSDGAGTPAEWAQAAKAAGYDVVCFTEALDRTDIADWPRFVAACALASDATVTLLPGLDMGTDLGDRFLIVGHTGPVRTHLLTDDRKRLFWTGHMLLGMGDVLPIAARPGWLATKREKGALPPDLYSHCPGVAIATYRDGRQVDDGLPAYKWLTDNASLPIPAAIHELYAPAELHRAVTAGLQNYVNADTAAHAAFYFRQGHASFGGNPARRYVSSGPRIASYAIDNWRSPTWKISLTAHAAQPITAVTARDQYGVYRQFRPNATTAAVAWSGNLAIQRWFLTEVTDAAGGTAYLSPLRTLPRLSTIRCMDRQNWFTPLPWSDMVYTGRATRWSGGTAIAVPGVTLTGGYCPKFQVVYSGEGYYIHEFTQDSTYVPDGRDPGADNSPIFHDVPIPEYAGRTRYISFMSGKSIAFRQYQARVTVKTNLPQQGPVWPLIAKVTTGAPYVYTEPATGRRVEGTIPKDGWIDLPVGGVAGTLLALTPLRVTGAGQVGLACAAERTIAAAGTDYSASFLLIDPKKCDEIRQALGFDGPTPFSLALTQGTLDRVALYLHLTAKEGGIAGRVTGGKMPVLGWIPARLSGANSRWPVGVWTPSPEASKVGTLTHYDFLDGVALGRINVTADGTFYFGNLVRATKAELHLAFAADWTKDGTVLEVHNPTPKRLTATITSPQAITDRKPITVTVTVPASGTVYVPVK